MAQGHGDISNPQVPCKNIPGPGNSASEPYDSDNATIKQAQMGYGLGSLISLFESEGGALLGCIQHSDRPRFYRCVDGHWALDDTNGWGPRVIRQPLRGHKTFSALKHVLEDLEDILTDDFESLDATSATNATAAAVGPRAWGVNAQNQIFQWTGSAWQPVTGTMAQVSDRCWRSSHHGRLMAMVAAFM